jgi:PAS domain S-box-containing protein
MVVTGLDVNGALHQHSQLEAQLQATLDLVPAHAWYARLNGALAFVNVRTADYLGLPTDHPLRFGTDTGADWDSHIPLLHPDDGELTRRVWSDCLRTGSAGEVSFRVRNAEGGYRWFLGRAEPVRAPNGTLLYWIGVNLDIDDRRRAEESLRLQVDILQHLPAVSWTALPTGIQDFASQQSQEYTGQSSPQAWMTTLHPDDHDHAWASYWEGFRSGKGFTFEARFRRASDGAYRWHLNRAVPVQDLSGKLLRFVGTCIDIEDQKRAEQAQRESEQSFRLMVDGIAGLVATMTSEGEVELVNRQVLEYFGKTLEDLKGWTASDAVHPKDLPQAVAAWTHSVQTGDPYDVDHRLRRADGVYRWFHSRGLPLRDCEGRIVRWYNLLTDIDERKTVAENLRRSEESLLEAQRLSHTGSFKHDVLTGALIASPEVYRIYGIDPNGGSNTEFFFTGLHPEDRKGARELFERTIREKTPFKSDHRVLLQDGSIKYLHSAGHPLTDESGEVVEVVGTIMDVTEQWNARADLEQAFKEIEFLKDRLQRENIALRDEVDRTSMFEEIVGTSKLLKAVLLRVAKVAPTDSTVLITGETGTGKELIARAVHKRSQRSGRVFVSVNCAALAPTLISSELFGHEKGAFTGATQRRLGRFELADGGTIFLDEVSELLPDTQAALLRVLQEREFERVGGIQPVRIDVRVIAATNRDLSAAVANGTFRQDLFYRLNVFPIALPPLRERKEDILMLVEYFVQRYAKKAGKNIRSIDKKTLDVLQSYDWPGNIRELQNVIERSVILNFGEGLSVDQLCLSGETSRPQSLMERPGTARPNGEARSEREIIEEALAESRGRISGRLGAAAKLRIPASTLASRIKALKINRLQFKFR